MIDIWRTKEIYLGEPHEENQKKEKNTRLKKRLCNENAHYVQEEAY